MSTGSPERLLRFNRCLENGDSGSILADEAGHVAGMYLGQDNDNHDLAIRINDIRVQLQERLKREQLGKGDQMDYLWQVAPQRREGRFSKYRPILGWTTGGLASVATAGAIAAGLMARSAGNESDRQFAVFQACGASTSMACLAAEKQGRSAADSHKRWGTTTQVLVASAATLGVASLAVWLFAR
jgi:hypothetical protein